MKAEGIKICHTVGWKEPDDYLSFLKEIGLNWVCLGLGDFNGKKPTYEVIRGIKERLQGFGLEIYSAWYYAYRSHDIQLGRSGRDEEIANYNEFIRSIGKLGISVSPFDFHPGNTYTTEMVKTIRGYLAREFNLHLFRNEIEEMKFDKNYSSEEIFDNYRYFINRVLPVAEESGVKLALHPDDPPISQMNGVERIFYNSDGFKRAEEVVKGSEYWGLRFCVGTWAEGGEDMGKDVFEMIKHYGGRGKIFEVHFRNVSSTLPVFHETLLDDGYLDMYLVIKALREINYDGVIFPDHIPHLTGDDEKQRAGLAYLVAYMRSLLNRANEEQKK
jgi:mannonate dehydratase